MVINGKYETRNFPSVSHLLETYQLTMEKVIVEVNGEIIPKVQYDDRVLKDDDRIEIISFVGGG